MNAVTDREIILAQVANLRQMGMILYLHLRIGLGILLVQGGKYGGLFNQMLQVSMVEQLIHQFINNE